MVGVKLNVFLAILPTLIISATWAISNQRNNSLKASSPAGNFLGYEGTSYSGKFFVAFSGIRFANAPVNDLRYQDPVTYEYDKEQQVEAIKEGPDCMQYDITSNEAVGEEDCLFLNIYTPNVTGRASVIIFIFGGAFWEGSISNKSYGPEYFLDENVVLVTINYRLGALGYASTGDNVLPGNLGQKDQAEAVRWVFRNIRYFGGDPENLTLMGHSSGAASVAFHLKSPGIKNLIKRGIAIGGSTLSPWAASNDHRVRNKTFELAKLLGCPTESLELFNCLQGMNGSTILGSVNGTRSDVFDMSPFRPILNEETTAGDFTVDVPLLVGFTESEAAYFCNIWAAELGTTIPELIMEIKPNFTSFLIRLLTLNPETPESDLEPLARSIGDFYWDGKNDTSYTFNNVLPVVQAISDIFVTYSVYREAQLTRSDLYTFFFNYNPNFNAVTSLPLYGTSHIDEIMYLFPSETTDLRSAGSDSDRQMSVDFVKMLVDFANGQNPTPNLDWNGTSSQGGYLEISNSGFNLVDVKNEDSEMANRLKFWANFLREQIGKN